LDLGNSASKHPAKANDASVNSIEILLSTAREEDLTSTQVSEAIAQIVNGIRRNKPDLWQQIVNDVRAQLMESSDTDTPSQATQSGIASDLERTYEGLQASLSHFRQAVAAAVASEKQLEQELTKAKDIASTWANRAAMALKEGKIELRMQAQERELQYADAAKELEAQLQEFRATTSTLRQNLTDTELSVQKAHTQKQILKVRENAARAQIRANDLISSLNVQSTMEQLKQIETLVVDLESKAASNTEHPKIELDANVLLLQTAAALERATTIMVLLEKRLPANGLSLQPNKET
jgi:phage shock protein A